MSATFLVIDARGFGTLVGAGAFPRDTKVFRAEQIQGWKSGPIVVPVQKNPVQSPTDPDISVNNKNMRQIQPFLAKEGDCLFEKNGKLSFSGSNGKSNVLMMFFSNFPAVLEARKSGTGRLLGAGPGLSAGAITWEIVATEKSSIADNVGSI